MFVACEWRTTYSYCRVELKISMKTRRTSRCETCTFSLLLNGHKAFSNRLNAIQWWLPNFYGFFLRSFLCLKLRSAYFDKLFFSNYVIVYLVRTSTSFGWNLQRYYKSTLSPDFSWYFRPCLSVPLGESFAIFPFTIALLFCLVVLLTSILINSSSLRRVRSGKYCYPPIYCLQSVIWILMYSPILKDKSAGFIICTSLSSSSA